MTKGVVLAAIVLLIAATYWRPLRRVRKALAIDYLLSTGHAFLVLGYVLGFVFAERPAPLASDLDPIVAFVAGWVGFAAGMRFDRRVLRTVPVRVYLAGLMPAAAAALLVAGASVALLLAAGAAPAYAGAAALTLGAAAASSGPTLVAILRGRRAGRSSLARPVLRLIEFSAGIDDLLVVLLATVAFAVFRIHPDPVAPGWLIALTLGGGALLGAVTWLFLGGRAKEDERLLLGLAMLAFIGGFAGWLYLSPAAVAAISAMVLVNMPGQRMAQLLAAVQRVERPAVVILMTVIGFHLAGPISWLFWPLVAAMTLVRFAAKQGGGAGASRLLPALPGMHPSRGWAGGLAPQGLLGLMVALGFFHVWHDDGARTVLAAVAVASVLNELVAPWLMLRVLRRIVSPPPSTAPGSERKERA